MRRDHEQRSLPLAPPDADDVTFSVGGNVLDARLTQQPRERLATRLLAEGRRGNLGELDQLRHETIEVALVGGDDRLELRRGGKLTRAGLFRGGGDDGGGKRENDGERREQAARPGGWGDHRLNGSPRPPEVKSRVTPPPDARWS